MAVTRFQDLIAWQKARVLTTEVYRSTREGQFARDWGLASQIQRSSVSIMANIAEGFERNRRSELLRALDIAKGSCSEVMSHLYVAHDVGYLDAHRFEILQARCAEVGRILAGLQNSVRRSEHSP